MIKVTLQELAAITIMGLLNSPDEGIRLGAASLIVNKGVDISAERLQAIQTDMLPASPIEFSSIPEVESLSVHGSVIDFGALPKGRRK